MAYQTTKSVSRAYYKDEFKDMTQQGSCCDQGPNVEEKLVRETFEKFRTEKSRS